MKKRRKASAHTLQSVKDWLRWADQDYVSARILFLSGTPFVWFTAAVVAHLALEKLFKTVLVSHGKCISEDTVWGHNLEDLARQCTQASLEANAGKAAFFHSDFYAALKRFTDYFDELRYPTKLQRVRGLGLEELDLLDNLVSVIRPQVRFEVEGVSSRFEELYPESSVPFSKFVSAARKDNRFWGKF